MRDPLHILGCDLIGRVERAIDATVSFDDLGYQVVDEIVGVDLNGVPARFAVLLVHTSAPRKLIVAVRGTEKAIEWVSDGIAILVTAHFAVGRIEAGFRGIYGTFALKSGRLIHAVFGLYDYVLVMGHSLGGPLATYLAAQMGAHELVCYASPKAGDAAFAKFVCSVVDKVTLYDCKPDVVPGAPLTIPDPLDRFNFVHVAALTTLDPAQAVPVITLPAGIESLEFAHSLTTYKALLLTCP